MGASTDGQAAVWVVIGDSFSDLRHSGYVESGVTAWPALVAERLGIDVRNYASSGDGYVHRKTIVFPEQAACAASDASAGAIDAQAVERVIVYGGINDYSMGVDAQAVERGAAQTARTLASAFPNARIECFYNWYPHKLDDAARACIGAIAVGMGAAGVALRTDSMWILENDEVQGAYLPDNLHPNQHGHDLMADFFCRQES